jgi:hypothetical protein
LVLQLSQLELEFHFHRPLSRHPLLSRFLVF